jgi:hypothetical protein
MYLAYADVLKVAQEVANERPDHIYHADENDKCWYVKKDEKGNLHPDCLIGVIGFRFKPDADMSCLAGMDFSPERAFEELGIFLTPKASIFLAELQSMQDRGISWGRCVERGMDTAKHSTAYDKIPPEWVV